MGLAGRKSKQRIGADPRNLTWADDAAKFGQAYLAKMGWDASQGLGVNGDGRTSHIKVAQKLNLLGIGAGAQQQGPDGVAWKQNRDYELLLKRLNESVKDDVVEVEDSKEVEEGEGEEVDEEAGKKRKLENGAAEDGNGEEGSKKRKKERKEKKKEKKDKDEKEGRYSKNSSKEKSAPPPDSPVPTPVHAPRPMAHRARFLRSKQLASRSSRAVAEILGISGSATPVSYPASASASPYPPDSGSVTPVPEAAQELTTATKSVADYFKEKLAARASAKSVIALAASSSEDTEAPSRMGIGANRSDYAPRGGIGSAASFGSLMGKVGALDVAPSPLCLEAEASGTREDRPSKDEGKRDKKKKKEEDLEQRGIVSEAKRKKEKKERNNQKEEEDR